MSRVFVTGASGLIGRRLCRALADRGDEVLALSRRGAPSGEAEGGSLRWVRGDPNQGGDWLEELAGCDAVFHLAGEPIAGGRWTKSRKQRLVDSRVSTTRRIVAALRSADRLPKALLCASASGYYGARGDELLDESSAPGDDFLARLCVDWEAAAAEASELGLRVVNLRLGVVLSADGGALDPMVRAFRLFAGGPLGPAGRFFPWIHEADAVKAMVFAHDHPVEGPLNLVAPDPVTMGGFAAELGQALRRPSWLPLPEFALGIALGEMGQSLVPGQRIVPRALEAAGFAFDHPALSEALLSCVG